MIATNCKSTAGTTKNNVPSIEQQFSYRFGPWWHELSLFPFILRTLAAGFECHPFLGGGQSRAGKFRGALRPPRHLPPFPHTGPRPFLVESLVADHRRFLLVLRSLVHALVQVEHFRGTRLRRKLTNEPLLCGLPFFNSIIACGMSPRMLYEFSKFTEIGFAKSRLKKDGVKFN